MTNIMKRAWEIFKATKLIGNATYDMVKKNKAIAVWAIAEVFPKALRQAWAEYKASVRAAEVRAANELATANRAAEIAAMTPTQRLEMLTHFTHPVLG